MSKAPMGVERRRLVVEMDLAEETAARKVEAGTGGRENWGQASDFQ